jgi:hypothetical protein
MLETPPSYVQQDGAIPTTCPSCGNARSIPKDKLDLCSGRVEVTCPCGATFTILAEFRKAYRREANLRGTYTKTASAEERVEIEIANMSMTGVGIIVEKGHGISEGDELTLHIVVDNSECQDIQAVVEVIHVSEMFAGCRFIRMSAQQENALADYLIRIP